MRKQASLTALIGTHIAQNIIGAKMVNSEDFRKKVTQDFVAGATARKAHHGQFSDHLSSAGLAVAVPEGAIIRNTAYDKGQHVYKHLRLEGIDPNKLTRKDLALAKMELEGKGHILTSRGLSDHPVVKSIRKVMGTTHINGRVDSELVHNVSKLPMGNLPPHSKKLMVASNAALSILDPATAALNASKLAMDTKVFANSRLGHYIEKKLTIDPVREAVNKGAEGIALNPKLLAAKKYLMNGAIGQIEHNANNIGLTHGPEAKQLVDKAHSIMTTAHKSAAHKVTAESGTIFSHIADQAAHKVPASPMGKKLFRYALKLSKV